MFKTFWSIPVLEKDGFPKEEEVLSFRWGVGGTSGEHSGSSGDKGMNVGDFSVSRKTGRGSGALFVACANGIDIPTIILWMTRQTGKTILTFASFRFSKGFISSVRPGGSSHGKDNDDPLEEISISFEAVKTAYSKG